MPGIYSDGEYDLAGTIVGVVEKSKIITGANTREGDALIALPSTGLHTNGYSLARKLLLEMKRMPLDAPLPESDVTLGEELLRVHRSYVSAIEALMKADAINGAAHITGGGITDNLPRVLPKGLAASIDTKSWHVPPIFELMRSIGSLEEEDWRRTFNVGVGIVFAVPRAKAGKAMRVLKRAGESPWIIGEVIRQRRGKPRVEYR
jgi:phosphoribosylformylglycinamidine cyclo-ligase